MNMFISIWSMLLALLFTFTARCSSHTQFFFWTFLVEGLILIVTKNEEWTFWLLKILVENTIRSYHTKTMTGLIADIAVLRQLLETRVPDVCKHLDNCSLPTAVITTKWFICLFAEVLPIETVLRVWDCLFYEGHKVSADNNLLYFISL